jgi:hypothetical protein
MKHRGGHYAVAAIKEFFECPDRTVHDAGAVYVDLRDGKVCVSKFNERTFEQHVIPEEWRGFEIVPEYMADWSFPIQAKENKDDGVVRMKAV